MIRKIFLLSILALALPVAVFADSIDFSNMGGTLSGTASSGLTMSSTLTSVNGLGGGGLITANIGTVTLTTGALLSGSLGGNATFAQGGTFTVTGNGTNGVPSGVLFTATFTSPMTWSVLKVGNTFEYTLTGVMSGPDGVGVVKELTIDTGTTRFNGETSIASGDINVQVPDSGTMSLLATSLITLIGAGWKKAKASC
ncbi:MAG: hypothetical protein JOY93_04945 [Acidobacteriales bacterium]|nr:hypothetical protein [Terriglobales bacterium]